MSTVPKFSVVIPTYNRAESLTTTLQSVLAQKYRDFEIIVVDDGSCDDSASACSKLGDSRIKYVWQENAGPAAARNHGCRQASGQFIAYLDSDDRWHEDYLQDAAVQLNGVDESTFLYGQIVVDRGVEKYWIKPVRAKYAAESIFDYLYLHGGFMQTSTMIIPAALAEKVAWEESITFGDNDQYAIDLCALGARSQMQSRALVWYLDIDSGDALSQLFIHDASSQRYRRFFHWMESNYPTMSAQSRAGFEAHFVSGLHAWQSPLRSWKLLWHAYRLKAIRGPGLLRQLLQNYAPGTYRKLTNFYVSRCGLSVDKTPF